MKDYDLNIQYHLRKANIVVDVLSQKAMGKLNVLITEQRCLHKEIGELELEVVTWRIEGLCAVIIVELTIL